MSNGSAVRAGDRRRVPVLAALVLAATLGLATAPAMASARAVDLPRVDRVLMFVVPGLEWSDVRTEVTPNLAALRSQAGIGLLSTRLGKSRASLGDAYLTIGAGTRALSVANDGGLAFGRDELVAGRPAHERYRQATGRATNAAIVHLSINELVKANEASAFDAQPGTLGSALARAGIERAVVANGDRREVPPDSAPFRAAVATLMDTRGRLTAGTVDPGLLRADPLAPFGLRFADGAVERAFDRWWPPSGDRGVVMVEASDAYRAVRSLPRATPERADAIRTDALRSADALLGRLLERIDPSRDAVMVLGIPVPTTRPSLGAVALRAPGWEAGRVLSASTRRAGYLTLADVAPTVLGLLRVDAEISVEGEPAYLDEGSPDGTAAQRELEQSVEAAVFRTDALGLFMPTVGICTALVLGLELWRRRRRVDRVALARPLALVVLAVVSASFLVALRSEARYLAGPFLVTLGVIAGLLAAVALVADRIRSGAGSVFLLACVVLVIAIDLMAGAQLQLNTMFGLSTEVGGRFAGLGNLGYALLAPATLILAVHVARAGDRRAVRIAVLGIFAAAILVDGLPYLGADAGGVISMVPAFACTYWILAGTRIGPARVAAAVAASVLTVVLFGFLDLTRPEREQAHLARLARQVSDSGPKWLVTTVARRWQGNFGSPVASLAVLAVLIGLVVLGVLMARRVIRRARATHGSLTPPAWFPRQRVARAQLVGLSVLGVLGLFANDSGVAVPGVMLIVIICAVASSVPTVPVEAG